MKRWIKDLYLRIIHEVPVKDLYAHDYLGNEKNTFVGYRYSLLSFSTICIPIQEYIDYLNIRSNK